MGNPFLPPPPAPRDAGTAEQAYLQGPRKGPFPPTARSTECLTRLIPGVCSCQVASGNKLFSSPGIRWHLFQHLKEKQQPRKLIISFRAEGCVFVRPSLQLPAHLFQGCVTLVS